MIQWGWDISGMGIYGLQHGQTHTSPIPPSCREWQREEEQNKGATPCPSPGALLWTLQIRFSEKEMFYRP